MRCSLSVHACRLVLFLFGARAVDFGAREEPCHAMAGTQNTGDITRFHGPRVRDQRRTRCISAPTPDSSPKPNISPEPCILCPILWIVSKSRRSIEASMISISAARLAR